MKMIHLIVFVPTRWTIKLCKQSQICWSRSISEYLRYVQWIILHNLTKELIWWIILQYILSIWTGSEQDTCIQQLTGAGILWLRDTFLFFFWGLGGWLLAGSEAGVWGFSPPRDGSTPGSKPSLQKKQFTNKFHSVSIPTILCSNVYFAGRKNACEKSRWVRERQGERDRERVTL